MPSPPVPVSASVAPLSNGLPSANVTSYPGQQQQNPGVYAMNNGIGGGYASEAGGPRQPPLTAVATSSTTGGQQHGGVSHQGGVPGAQDTSGMKTPPLAAETQMNGFSPWTDPLGLGALNLLSGGQSRHSLVNATTAFGGSANGDGWSIGHRRGIGEPLNHQALQMGPMGPHGGHATQFSQMPPPLLSQGNQMGAGYSQFPGAPPPQPPLASTSVGGGAPAPGQWGVGWGFQHVMNAPPAGPSPQPEKNFMRPLSRGASSPGPQSGMMDSRGSSPITAQNERHKRVETLMEQLRATFPSYSPDALRDVVNEFRSQQPGKTLKGMSVEQAVNGVVTLLLSKTPMSMSNYRPDAGQGGGFQHMTLDTFGGGGPEGCAMCGEGLRGHPTTVLKSCNHRFHQKCVKDWLTNQQTCPICRRFNPSPEEYPELGK